MAEFDVFISHATADDQRVSQIAAALRAAGITLWLDHEHGITYGDNWSRAIHDAANACAVGLFVMSTHSVRSDYCEAEWNRILALGKKLYTALIDPLPVREIPLRLGTIQYANLTTHFDAALADLIAAMKGTRDLDPDTSTTGQAKRISGGFPRYHLDLPLIGRDDELRAVERSLMKENRITLITGLGGVGKTRLAVEVAAQAEFADGVIWHEIAGYSTLADLTVLIRSHLGLPPEFDDDATWAELNQRAVLLVLDNAEVCKEPAAYARRLNNLTIEGGTRALVTSRARWPELRNVEVNDLRAPTPAAAADILRAMTETEKPEFSPDGQVEALAEAAHCHPRLMRYAVRWLDSYPVDHVLRTLQTLEGADAEEALEDLVQRTVRLVEEGKGGKETLIALRRLAVCRGGFTFEAAQAVMGEEVDPQALATLRRWGLVQLEGGRYEIDPLVAAAVGKDETAYQAHYDYYMALAQKHNEEQDYLGLDPESANLEAAFEQALATGQGENAYWLANACHHFLANRGRFDQRLDWMERAATVLSRHPDKELRAAVLVNLGIVYNEQPTGDRVGNLKRAIAVFEQALRYSRPRADPVEYARPWSNLGVAYANLAQFERRTKNLGRALAAFHEALRFWTPEATPSDYAAAQNNLGNTYSDLAEIKDRAGNLKRALAAYQEALRFWTPEAAPLDYAAAQNNLGNTYTDLAGIEDQVDNLGRAVAAFQEALRFRTPEAAPFGYAMVQTNLGVAYADLAEVEDQAGNLGRALAAFQEALRFHTPEAAPFAYAVTQNNLGNIYRSLSEVEDRAGNLGRALAAFQEALRFRTPEDTPLDYAMTQNNLGIVHEELGDLPAALTCWREAEHYYRLMGVIDRANLIQGWIKNAGG